MSHSSIKAAIHTSQAPVAVSLVDGTLEDIRRELIRERTRVAEAAGHERGRLEAMASVAEIIDAVVLRMESTTKELSEALRVQSVELAVKLCEHLMRRRISSSEYDIERIVRETLHASGVGRGECVVHLHPDDVARLEGIVFRSGTQIESDAEVGLAEVQVTSAHGLLVRDLDETLTQVAECLLEEEA